MSTFLYTRPNERLTGTVSVQTGTAAAGYPPEALDDGWPANPAKLEETSGAWKRDLVTATRVDFCAVIHHNLTAGVEVRLQGNTTDSWTSPAVNVLLPIPSPHLDAFTKNVWVDLTTVVPSGTTRTQRYWRLVVVTANTAPVAIGEWPMYSVVRNLGLRNISKGSQRTIRRPSIIHETDLLVRRGYDMGTTIRAVSVTLEPTDTVRTEVENWWRSAAGQIAPFVIVPHRDEDEAWFVTFIEQDLIWVRANRNHNPMSLQFQEVTRGLYL